MDYADSILMASAFRYRLWQELLCMLLRSLYCFRWQALICYLIATLRDNHHLPIMCSIKDLLVRDPQDYQPRGSAVMQHIHVALSVSAVGVILHKRSWRACWRRIHGNTAKSSVSWSLVLSMAHMALTCYRAMMDEPLDMIVGEHQDIWMSPWHAARNGILWQGLGWKIIVTHHQLDDVRQLDLFSLVKVDYW